MFDACPLVLIWKWLCVDLKFCGMKLLQTADFHMFCIFCRLTLLYIAYMYTLYTCIDFKRQTVGGQGSNDTLSGHSVHSIVRAFGSCRSYHSHRSPQVCMHTRHWSKFLALFRVPIRCRHTRLSSKVLQY